jgi:antitoxin ParD1/3/4
LAIFANERILFTGETQMPTRNVNLTPELDNFITAKIESGRYENASEVVRAALRELEREEQEHEAKMVALIQAIEEGDASGVATGDVFADVRKALNLPARATHT